jgi:hypothetical protein
MVPYFYNGTIRKYIIMFGRMFNDIDVVRYNNDNETVQSIRVPIAYGPSEKWLTRLDEDASLNKPVSIQLPRLGFELTSMNYDPSRTLNKMTKSSSPSTYTNTVSSQYTPIPYNFNITLSGMFSYQEDAVQVTEQIIPFFRPEWTMSLKLMDSVPDYYDIPTVLNNMSMEDTYESDFLTRRAIIYTWDFTVKGYLFGPVRNKGVIKRAITDFIAQDSNNPITEEIGPHKKVTLTPGLTAAGTPTSNTAESVPITNIKENDNWGYAFEEEDFFDGVNRHDRH